MKKRFALYGMFAAMALFATACGDDSSSGPEEESSSSIEAEDESSSSHSGEGAPESSEESGDAKSSAEEKDAKSSSSEAKKGDSSSSEEASSSSSEAVSSSSVISYEPTCNAKTEGSTVSIEVHIYATDRGGDVKTAMTLDYENFKVYQTLGFANVGVSSCDEAKSLLGPSVVDCSLENKTIMMEDDLSNLETFEYVFGPIEDAEETVCTEMLHAFVADTTALNQEMLAAGKYGTFRDTRDAMLYRTIKIGDQTWMAQNLNYETETGSSCYGDDSMLEGVVNANCLKYGRLYTWDVAKSACPTGWHLPTKDDFTKLAVNVDPDFDGTSESFDNGDKLKTEGWDDGSNEIGFSAVPGGIYIYNYGYSEMDDEAYFWSQTVDLGVFAMILRSDKGEIIQDGADEVELSVRCIKDDAPAQPGASK